MMMLLFCPHLEGIVTTVIKVAERLRNLGISQGEACIQYPC